MDHKITINDITDHDNIEDKAEFLTNKDILLQTLVDEQQEKETKKQIKSLYEHVPKSKLEKEINNVLLKNKEYLSKLNREKTFKLEFEKKMARLKKIKSRGYRKLRKKIKEKYNLESKSGNKEDIHIPDFLIKDINNNHEQKIMNFGDDESSSSSQEEFVKKVFNDDFGEEFKKEKENIIKPVHEKIILPGWGTWGGKNIEIKATPVNTIESRIENVVRADKDLHHVIINKDENKNKIKTKLPKNLTPKEYMAMLNIPISKEWNTARIFNKLVKNDDEKSVEKIKYNKRYLD